MEWSHERILALPQQGTQNRLLQAFFNISIYSSESLVDKQRAIKTMSAAGHSASVFLHTPENLPGCSMSNQEFDIVVKLRLGLTIHPNLPDVCSCGASIDAAGNHLLTCKRGNSWVGHKAHGDNPSYCCYYSLCSPPGLFWACTLYPHSTCAWLPTSPGKDGSSSHRQWLVHNPCWRDYYTS